MRILMIVPYYAPDLGPSAPLFTMLATGLAQRGHEVTVIAAVPHYPSGQVPLEFRGRWIRRTTEDGVKIVRVAVPSIARANLVQRLLQYASYQVGATWVGLGERYDALFVANPALWTWLPFASLAVLRRRPAIFSVHDVYPDVGVTLGIFRHKPVIAAVAAIERYCLSHAAQVRILSESFRPGLRRLGVPDSKMVLVYDWVDTDLIRPLPRDNAFAREHGLADGFVALYAGNLGLSQGLEQVLTAAESLALRRDIRFVFVGDGAARQGLVEEASKRQLSNVQFLPYQPRSRLPEVLASADVSLVVLRRGVGLESLPSKCFSILASGRPILASVDEQSETWNLVRRADAGVCVPPERPVDLAQAILSLQQDGDLRRRLGRNGRAWAEQHHSPRSAAARFEELLAAALAPETKIEQRSVKL
jgi:colanic acid biosynthesis glycosyl transferase WcaI